MFVIYMATPSRQYDADVLGELKQINNLDTSSADPAHMLYVRLGVPVYWAWQKLDYQGDALRAMQVVNALFGAVSVGLFAAIAAYFAQDHCIQLLLALLYGVSYGVWTHTVDAFFIVPAMFLAFLALWLSLSTATSTAGRPTRLLVFLSGVAWGLSILAFQANAALGPALVAAHLVGRDRIWARISWGFLIWLTVGMLLVAGIGLMWQAINMAQVESWSQAVKWLLFQHGGMTNGLWRRQGIKSLPIGALAWLATLLPVYEGLRLSELVEGKILADRLAGQLSLLFLAGLGIAILFQRMSNRAPLERTHWRKMTIAILWLAVPGLAVFWFDPAEVKLWLIPLAGLWWLVGLLMAPSGAASRRLRYLLAAQTLLVGIASFNIAVWPNHSKPSRAMNQALVATRYLTEHDLLISAGFDWSAHLTYLSDSYQVFNPLYLAQTLGDDSVRQELQEAVNSTFESGGHVYIMDYFGPGLRNIWEDWITPYTSLTQEDFAIYHRTQAWLAEGDIIWELLPPY